MFETFGFVMSQRSLSRVFTSARSLAAPVANGTRPKMKLLSLMILLFRFPTPMLPEVETPEAAVKRENRQPA